MSTPIRYFTDEHVATAIAKGLRKRGIDVLTVSEADLLGTDDEDLFPDSGRGGVPCRRGKRVLPNREFREYR